MLSVSIDIDGTISEYPKYWLEFIKRDIGIQFVSVESAKKSLGKNEYSRLKNLYRNGSAKYSIPIRNEMLELANTIYKNGGQVFVNSRRPFNEYPQMLNRTKDWLTGHGFPFESIQEKSEDNLRMQKVIYHLDDELEECARIETISTIKKFFFITSESFEQNLPDRFVKVDPNSGLNLVVRHIFL